jgi:hypothetical protein
VRTPYTYHDDSFEAWTPPRSATPRAIRSPPSSQASSPTSICVVTTYTIIVLGILSILPIRPVRPDSSARTRCWRAEATQRAASRPRHYRHRDLIVSIVVGTYIYLRIIIATVQSERHPLSPSSRDHHPTRATRFSPNPRRSPPLLRAKMRRMSNPCDQVLSATSAFRSLIGIRILRVDIDVIGTQ